MAAYKDKLRQQNFNVPRRSFYRMEKKEKKHRPKNTDRKNKKPATPAARRAAQLRTAAPVTAVSVKLRHEEETDSRDENSGVSAADTAGGAAEAILTPAGRSIRSSKVRHGENDRKGAGEKLSFFDEDADDGGAGHTEINRKKSTDSAVGADPAREAGTSNPLSRNQQRKNIRRRYADAARKGQVSGGAEAAGEGARQAGSVIQRIAAGLKETFKDVGVFVADHLPAFLITGTLMLILAAIMGGASSCSLMVGGSGNSVVATSFTSEDEDILGTEDDYKALEEELREEISSVETDRPGYDEYKYVLDETGHNPYELAALMTLLFEDYRRDDPKVQEMLQTLFDAQYELSFEEEKEERTREVTKTATRNVVDPATGQVTTQTYTYTDTEVYEYHILNITLKNNTLRKVIDDLKLTGDEMERFEIILSLKGNRPYLFPDDIYANIDADAEGTPQNPYLDYRVPGEALTDAQFARMLQEAEKYLNRPYVWGGSSPSQGFDCSGYVCWVINHSGAGNIGRTTAEGIRQWTDPIPASERKPGDIVYFQGTYDTPGASHVGIYVGGGMMIHCGNPCKYSNIDSGYFARHMLGYGRIPQQP